MKRKLTILMVLALPLFFVMPAKATSYAQVHYHSGKRCTEKHHCAKKAIHVLDTIFNDHHHYYHKRHHYSPYKKVCYFGHHGYSCRYYGHGNGHGHKYCHKKHHGHHNGYHYSKVYQ